MDSNAFLHAQSTEYQRHLSQLTEIRTALDHQLTIQSFRTIPKQYQPQNHLKTSNPTLTDEFISEYHQLFFRHLERVITNNQIKLELHKATLSNIIIQTEVHLSKSLLTPEEVTTLYTKFCQDNDITERVYPYQNYRQSSNQRKTIHQNRKEGKEDKNESAPLPPHIQPNNPDRIIFYPQASNKYGCPPDNT